MSIIADVLENYRRFSRRSAAVVNLNGENVTDEHKWNPVVKSGKFENYTAVHATRLINSIALVEKGAYR